MPQLTPVAVPDTVPVCPYFSVCGGCDCQDVSYPRQIAAKEAWLQALFAPLNLPVEIWRPCLAAADYPIYFRNKIRFSFIWHEGKVWPSRHRRGEEGAEVPITQCYLQSPEADALMWATARIATKHNWSLYNPASGQGWLKHILIRQAKATGELLFSAVTSEHAIPQTDEFIDELQSATPTLTSIYHTTGTGKRLDNLTDKLLWGATHIHEQVGSFRYAISPQAFFQTNSAMVSTLYEAIAQAAGTGKVLWDLYAGSATIGCYLSQQFNEVLSIESNPANIADAKLNLALNKVTNLKLVPGLVEEVLTSQCIQAQQRPDCIVVDPPRAGLHERLRTLLPHLQAPRLVYVSCNPYTCLRDCLALTKANYRIEYIQPVDMFPHSWHAELIAVFSR